MKTYRIAVIGGDGIGPEVTREAMKILRRAALSSGQLDFEFTELPWGCTYFLKTGRGYRWGIKFLVYFLN